MSTLDSQDSIRPMGLIEITISDDVGLAKQLYPLNDKWGLNDSINSLASHLMNKYSNLYDTSQLWTVPLMDSVLEKIIAQGEQYDHSCL